MSTKRPLKLELRSEFIAIMRTLSAHNMKPVPLTGKDGHALEEPVVEGIIGMAALWGKEPIIIADTRIERKIAARLRRLDEDVPIWQVYVYDMHVWSTFRDDIAPRIRLLDTVEEVELVLAPNLQLEEI